MTTNNLGLDVLFNAGAALMSNAKEINGTPVVALPEGWRVHDLEDLLSAPTRQEGTTVLRDDTSFIAYVNKQKSDITDLYYQIDPPIFAAVFDGERPGKPAWGKHRATYKCPISKEWATWTGFDGKKMTQEDFARFIENNLPDIIEPESAAMLEIATTLEAKKKVTFSSGLRLSNGSNELSYDEEVQGTAAKGKMKIPERIRLVLPVFENGVRYYVDANFRYRINGGALSMWYELVRPHKIIEDAVKELREKIEKETEIQALNGHPAN